MTYIALAFLMILLLLWLVVLIVAAQMFFRASVGVVTKKYAPFVTIPDNALPLLNKMSIPGEGAVIYDLGCGNGKTLVYLARKFPQAMYVGIEYNLLPYVLARLSARGYENITIKYKNFFKEDLSNASAVVVYLYPELIDALLPKFEEELRTGATLYSFDFALSKKKPDLIEQNEDASASRGKRMVVYRF